MNSRTITLSKISPDVKLGKGVKICDFVNLYGCEIGDNTKIGTFVEIQKGAKIGKNCKIQSHTFICEGVTIEDNTVVKKGASIGSSATLLCGIIIGENAMVGAGSVVTKDVSPRTLVAGNPARIIRKLNDEKLSDQMSELLLRNR